MIEKHYVLSEDDFSVIENVQHNMGLNNSAEALRYIIRQYAVNEKKEAGIQLAILKSIEEKTALLLDVANTDLVKREDKICYPVSIAESPVITKAREIRKKELANKKQKKDYRSKKR